MAWNDSDDDNNPRDPWSKRPNQDGPPDLDEVLRKLRKKMQGLMGITPGASGGKEKGAGLFGLLFILVLFVIIWALSGIFIVSPAEESVILRFGHYHETVGPGPHWIPRFIESNYTVNVQQVSTFPYRAEMLTKDENIVSVAVAVQYRVDNLRDYLFNIVDPIESLQQVTASALRQVVGQTTLDAVLTTERKGVRDRVQQEVDVLLTRYRSGLIATDVTLQPAKPPEAVTAAFDDAIKAREDEQRYINRAEAYAKKVVPVAQGQAARLLQNAGANKEQLIYQAKAHTAQFLAILPEFSRAPEVTRERLYLDTVESVLDHTSKVLVDVKGSNNMLYLPLDKLFKGERLKAAKLDSIAPETPTVTSNTTDTTRLSRDNYSGRQTRGLN